MPVIERSVTLNVPVETVFRYLSEPTRLPEICSDVTAIHDVQRHSIHSTQFRWTCKMKGVYFEGRGDLRDTRHDHQLDLQTTGGIVAHVTWHLDTAGEGKTLLRMHVDYTLPAPLLKKAPSEVIVASNERTVAEMLNTIKALVEAKAEVS